MATMSKPQTIPALLRAICAALALDQKQPANRLGVSTATLNRWENAQSTPQKHARAAIAALATEAGITTSATATTPAPKPTRRRAAANPPSTKPMEQMLWDAACSIRGEKDAAKFKDYLLPLLFFKRLSDVFDDEIARLAKHCGDRQTALTIAADDHETVRFYLPPEARWAVISARELHD